MVDRLIDSVSVDFAGAAAVDRCPGLAERFGQLRLVVGADPFTRGVSFGVRGHNGTVLCPEQTGRRVGLTSRP